MTRMHYTYNTNGTCSRKIDFDLNDGVVTNVVFTGGCDGNLKSIPLLIEGWQAQDVVSRLKGVTCGWKETSCGDQLATALAGALAKEKN